VSVTVTVTVDGCCSCPPVVPPTLVWHIGPPMESTEDDRVAGTPPESPPVPRKADVIMDLQADKKVALSVEFTDEVGNAVPMPTGETVVYTVDDPSIINLTDNGDGTASAAATGTLGTANVHVDATGSLAATGDLQIVVVAGDAERLNVVAGAPEEVTPDV
jgi:hypothetical protein